MTTYRFILTPLDTIFFGDEKSPFKQEYFQRSRYLPQQSGVLGFVRHEALRRGGLLGHRHDEWAGLIGKSSFNGGAQTFGVIQKVGAAGIIHKKSGCIYYPLRDPLEFKMQKVAAKVHFGDGTDEWDDMTLFQNTAPFKRYDPKFHDQFGSVFSDYSGKTLKAECPDDEAFYNKHGFKRPKVKLIQKCNKDDVDTIPEGIFWKDTRPGITKNYGGVPNNEGFYKTEFLRMMPGFAYSFTASIEETEKLKEDQWLQPGIVRFGGDRSIFRVEVRKTDAEDNGTGKVFILKSDTVAKNSIYEHCSAVVSDVRHFRNIHTESKASENFYNKRPGYKYGGSTGRVLLASGSMLIAKDDASAAALATDLQQDYAFTNIGYNQFKRLSSLPQGTIA